jgi:hypothetical protein
MKIMIALDTEDFLSDTAPDAQLFWAEELHKRGIRATFQMVGEMTRKLQRTKRFDVINAIKKHEIGYHSNYHSVHPTHPEAIEGKNLNDSLQWILNREESGIKITREVFGVNPSSYTTPGTSWTPATLIANYIHGIKVSFISPYPSKYRPYWYCGQLILDYCMNFEKCFGPDLDVDNFYLHLKKFIKKLEPIDGLLILYTHPGRIYTSQHWDVVYARGANPAIEKASKPPFWPTGYAEKNKDRIKSILDTLINDKELEFTDVASVYQENLKSKFDLSDIMKEVLLPEGQEGYIPLKSRMSNEPFKNDPIGANYAQWIPHKENFYPQSVFDQITGLAWTTRLGRA